MMGVFYRWVIAPAGLVAAFAIVQTALVERSMVMLVSYLSGTTTGLYFGLLLLRRRKSG